MESSDFARIRQHLGKTQAELANLLCVSNKAIQSFEQGWRKVPASAERQLLTLLWLNKPAEAANIACWEITKCPAEHRKRCIIWEYRAKSLCWLLTGTYCQGFKHNNWEIKIEHCHQCEVFKKAFPFMQD